MTNADSLTLKGCHVPLTAFCRPVKALDNGLTLTSFFFFFFFFFDVMFKTFQLVLKPSSVDKCCSCSLINDTEKGDEDRTLVNIVKVYG